MIAILLIVIVCSFILWAVAKAPDAVINADFKPIIKWGVIVVGVFLVLRALLPILGVDGFHL